MTPNMGYPVVYAMLASQGALDVLEQNDGAGDRILSFWELSALETASMQCGFVIQS
jgi:hypothetical protein